MAATMSAQHSLRPCTRDCISCETQLLCGVSSPAGAQPHSPACARADHYHDFEGGEACSVCGHGPPTERLPTPSAFPTEVLPESLYLGSYDHASRWELLKALGVSRILNVRPPVRVHPVLPSPLLAPAAPVSPPRRAADAGGRALPSSASLRARTCTATPSPTTPPRLCRTSPSLCRWTSASPSSVRAGCGSGRLGRPWLSAPAQKPPWRRASGCWSIA